MKLKNVSKIGQRFVKDNAPVLLAGTAVVGTVTTGVLAAIGAKKAVGQIHDVNVKENLSVPDPDDHVYLTAWEEIRLTWLCYMPAVASGTMTIGAVLLAHRINTQRILALAAAYSMVNDDFDSYKEKAKEFLTKSEQDKVKTGVAQDKVNKTVAEHGPFEYLENPNEVWIIDLYTGRPFKGNIEDVRAAVNDINALMMSEDHATLTDFYNEIGLTKVSTSDDFGWNVNSKLALEWSVTTTDDGKVACHSFDFSPRPVYKPWESMKSNFR